MAKTYTAIELGTHSVKLAVCDGVQVKKIIMERIPEGLLVDRRITSYDALADFLKQTIQANGGASKDAVVVLSRAFAVTRRVKFPLMTVSEVKLNLPYEFRDYITEKERFIFDYAVLGQGSDFAPSQPEPAASGAPSMGGSFGARNNAQAAASDASQAGPAASSDTQDRLAQSLDLLITAVQKETLEDFGECLHRAGLRMVSALPTTAALQNLMFSKGLENTSDQLSFCVADFGYATTDLYFFSGGKFDVLRTIEKGGRDINQALAEDLGMDEHIADAAKADDVNTVARSQRALDVCESIAVEIGRAVNFYGFNNPNTQLTALYGSGGEYLTTPLLDAVAGHTDIPLLDIETLYPSVDPAFAAAARLCPAAVGATLTVD